MTYDNAIGGNFDNAFGNLIEFRSIAQHFVVDACKFSNELLNGAFGVYQWYELVGYFVPVELIDGDIGNALFIVFTSCGFYVEYCVQMFKC